MYTNSVINMDQNTMLLLGLGFAASAVSAWWLKNRGKTISEIADKIEDVIEDATGIDVELDSVVETVVSSAEDVAEDVQEAVEESLESGDSLSEVLEDAVEAAQDAVDVDALQASTVAELKAQLKELGLPVSGKKADLVARILSHVNGGEME